MKSDIYSSIIKKSITYAQSNEYKSYDVSDLMKTKPYALFSGLSNNFLRRATLYLYSTLMKRKPEWIRKFVKEKGYIYPQGQAMVIRGLVTLAKKNNPLGDIEEAKKLADWLIKNSSPHSKHYGWGQPFLWYSRKPFPPNTPRATVSSQVAWAMLYLFEYTQDEIYLDVAKDVCYLFKEEFNYTPDNNGNFCVSYTTIDNYHIHNASMLAASVIFRVYAYTKIAELGEFGMRIADFTASHQNEDGSFYYWAPPDKLSYVIDNYHTGFVLESYKTIKEDCGDSRYDNVYSDGISFYYDNLFLDVIPKISWEKTYPIDIQSCSQSIMTFCLDGNQKYIKKAHEIADYTIQSFFLKDKNHFAYKIYENNFIDKSYYFRWADAWMIRALSYLMVESE
ncbi:hypothetical protein QUF58_05725 [Anaerolineales bacterium HSG24]|nr:hypothetical protein [Anaerolineales bacterium HSG24]